MQTTDIITNKSIGMDKERTGMLLLSKAVSYTHLFDSLDAAKEEGTAFVFMGHGTSHTAKISYSPVSYTHLTSV